MSGVVSPLPESGTPALCGKQNQQTEPELDQDDLPMLELANGDQGQKPVETPQSGDGEHDATPLALSNENVKVESTPADNESSPMTQQQSTSEIEKKLTSLGDGEAEVEGVVVADPEGSAEHGDHDQGDTTATAAPVEATIDGAPVEATADGAPPEAAVTDRLAALTAEKAALEKSKMTEKEVRALNATLANCRRTAQGIKSDVLRVLQERTSCEDDCLTIDRNIGEKLTALTAEVNKSTKGSTETSSSSSVNEETEPCEARTPIPVSSSGPSSLATVSGREKRANSKSATPPPTAVSSVSSVPAQDEERSLQDKICDLSRQDLPKKLSASSKKKAVESVLRSLSDLETPEEKLRVLCELHYGTLEQLREAQATADKWKKQFLAGQKESNRSLLARDRLEGLCRELQKHNNAIKEESALRRREEDEKRKYIAAKFQTTLTEISALMANTQEASTKLRQDNSQMASKLHTLVNHYDLWEKQAENMLKQKTIEAELAMAKLREAQLLRERDVKEVEHSRKMLEVATKEMQEQLEASLRNEILLREQLKLHNDKYEQFQEAIISSNRMVTDFKGEVESMGKQTRKFEKEALQWKQRWEEANLATARVFQEKTKSDLKVETLSRLCRSLQEKLRISNQEMAELECHVAGEVVTEEKAKLEEELSRKQKEIEQHKRALEAQQQEVQSITAESNSILTSKGFDSVPPASEDQQTPTEPSETMHSSAAVLADEGQVTAKKEGKRKGKKRH